MWVVCRRSNDQNKKSNVQKSIFKEHGTQHPNSDPRDASAAVTVSMSPIASNQLQVILKSSLRKSHHRGHLKKT